MPFDALSAKARLIVPVGAIESRCELRTPFLRICAFSSAGRRARSSSPRDTCRPEQRKGAAFLRELHGGPIGGVAHGFGNPRRHRARGFAVVAQAQHDERVAEAVNPRPTRRLFMASSCCALSGQAVTSSTLSSMRTDTSTTFAEALEVERGLFAEGFRHEAHEVDRAQAAAAVRRKRLLGARVVASIASQ